MDLSLEQRLLGFLWREEAGERRSFHDLRALSIEERVLEGECIQEAELLGTRNGTLVFRVTENLSKFRAGDPVAAGDGLELAGAAPLVYRSFDAVTGQLHCEPDRFIPEAAAELAPGTRYCLERRSLELGGRLHDSVRAAFADPALRAVLEGGFAVTHDVARRDRAAAALAAAGLDPAQVAAGAGAMATNGLALVQGPPGTGKTRLLATAVALLARAGCRVALSAFTHRAVDNALLALRRADPELALVKLGSRSADDPLRDAGVAFVRPKNAQLPKTHVVVAGTCFALTRLPPRERFHVTVFDEAGQLPIPHALAGMLLSRRWLFFGDHRQLPPVITARHRDRESARSVFEHLHGHYGSALLDVSYRLNDSLGEVVSRTFYDGALRSAASAAPRRLPFREGGALDALFAPEHGVVFARIDHLQPGMRSQEEANLVADLVEEAIRRHGVPAAEIAVVAPFRAQVRLIRSAVERKALAGHETLVIDTVERIQGQERELVIVSLAAGDPDSLAHRAAFFYSPNRLNVALSRARTKAILVGSRGAFEALPMEVESLRAAALFRRLAASVPQVDLTAVYGGVGAE